MADMFPMSPSGLTHGKRLRDDGTDQAEPGASPKKHSTKFETGDEIDLTLLTRDLKYEIAKALDGLCYSNANGLVTLRPLEITQCNAADEWSGIPFSKAYCSVRVSKQAYLMGDIFHNAIDMLTSLLKSHEIPQNKQQRFVLRKLLNYLANEDIQSSFLMFDELDGLESTTLLANHFFGKLATSDQFIIDNNRRRKGKKIDTCLCGVPSCKFSGSYGDTSIGNGEIWHGNLDVLMNNNLAINTLDEEPDSLVGKSPKEVKLKTNALSRNARIIAETIVFSFLQKRRHPEGDHFLFPCIGVGSEELIVYFYDSERDILLESSRIPLLNSTQQSVNMTAILVSWMVANYKYLCSGLTDEMSCENNVAHFFSLAEKKLHIYENDMKFGSVEISCTKEKGVNILSSDYLCEKHREISNVIINKSF